MVRLRVSIQLIKLCLILSLFFRQLDDILAIIKKRQKIMADEVQKRQKIGLKASEVGLRPVVLVADEIGSIVALMDSKQSKKFVADLTAIIQRGRSVGVSVMLVRKTPQLIRYRKRSVSNLRLRFFSVRQTLTLKEWHLEKLQQLEMLKISEGSILATD